MNAGKPLILVAIALGLGLLASWLAYRHIQKEVMRRTAGTGGTTTQIVVAGQDLAAGIPLAADNLAVRDVPESYISSDSVQPEQLPAITGALLLRPLRAGEALQFSAVKPMNEPSFAQQLRPGSRAMTLMVDEVSAVSGLLRPGDRIDLLAAYRSGAQEFSSALLQNVPVLATGTRRVRATPPRLQDGQAPPEDGTASGQDESGHSYSSITLELAPRDASRLSLAQHAGARLTAMLRNPEDRAGLADVRISEQQLFASDGKVRSARIPRPAHVATYIGGMGSGTLQPVLSSMANPQQAVADIVRNAIQWLPANPPAATTAEKVARAGT